MSTLQHHQHELELLNSNMENICHELEDLLLANEPHFIEPELEGAAARECYNYESISNTHQIFRQQVQLQQQQQVSLDPELLNKQHLEQQLELQLEQQLQIQLHHQQLPMENQQIQQFNNLTCYFSTTANQVPLNIDRCFVGAPATSAAAPVNVAAPNMPTATSGYAASNKYEFHYLRPQTFNKSDPNPNPIPLLSAATNFAHKNTDNRSGETRRNYVGGGAYRKQHNQKYNNKKNSKVDEEIDYDKIEINMEELGFTGDDMSEKNPVLRVIGKFRMLNYYLHDVFPYGPTMYGLPIQPKPIPYTMNIQYQVKNAARNCTMFICSKERVLNANKLLDREFYEECEKSINVLRMLHAQLETFKRIEFEHKRCQFVTQDAKVKAQHLESLLEQLSDQVRECNLLVSVFEWSMEMKHKTQTENLALANVENVTSLQPQNNEQNNDDHDDGDNNKDGQDGNNNIIPPEIENSIMRQPIRYIG